MSSYGIFVRFTQPFSFFNLVITLAMLQLVVCVFAETPFVLNFLKSSVFFSHDFYNLLMHFASSVDFCDQQRPGKKKML